MSDKSALAAQRCGADPDVWRNVHQWHLDRSIVCVTSPGHVSITGPITGISDDGFTIASAYTIRWSEAPTVEARS